MTDIFLYHGEVTPTDIILSDPTVPRGGGTDANVNVTGLAVATALGLVLALGGATITASGLAGLSDIGATVSTGSASTTAIGIHATANVGSSTISGSATIAASGVESVAIIGVVVPGVDTQVSATGISATAGVGTTITTGSAVVTPNGIEAQSTVGTVTAIPITEIAVTGLQAQTAIGSPASVTTTANIEVVGVQATAGYGAFVPPRTYFGQSWYPGPRRTVHGPTGRQITIEGHYPGVRCTVYLVGTDTLAPINRPNRFLVNPDGGFAFDAPPDFYDVDLSL